MAPSKLQKAIGRVKDQTLISLAKVGGSTTLSDLDVAIFKATRHEEYPADERYIREVISITSLSHAYIIACINTLSRRLNKTKSWTVALKSLILIQRLLAEGDPAYRQEIFFSTRRGTRILNLSDFRDTTSRNHSWDFSGFVRTYALYLDERLECKVQDRRREKGKEKSKTTSGPDEDQEEEKKNKEKKEMVGKSSHFLEMKTEQIFTTLQYLHQLLQRFLACRPTGAAKCNRVVTVALYQIVKESFQFYHDITEILSILVDRFVELDLVESVKVREIFCRQGKQFDELDTLYSWCKSVGIGRTSEYPEIQNVTQKKLDLIDELIKEKNSTPQRIEYNILPNDVQPENEVKEPGEIEEDVNAGKELPPPEAKVQEPPVEKELEKEDDSKAIVVKQEVDLLNLGHDAMSSEDHSEKFALALFDSGAPIEPLPGPSWEAIKDEADWESALVQSTSNLNHQKPKLGGGFDVLMLDGMYKHGQTMAVMASPGVAATGSASSVAFGSAGRPAGRPTALALPAPPSSDKKTMGANDSDPFARQ